ncbi:MAG: hypothetical protein LUG17_02070, partial [Clostridiales bacterium]|nr:hypothetical protein [Clostridiales bacterium]
MKTVKHQLRRLVALALALAMCLPALPAVAAAEDETTTVSTYSKVTSVNDLSTSDTVIVVASDYDVAMSTNQKSNNRGEIAITKSNDGSTVTATSTDSDEYVVQELEVQTGNVDGTYALYTGDGYLYAASSSSNYLKTESTLSDNSSWTITIEDGVATLLAQGTNTRNLMRYNSGSSLFACYSSGQQDISLYKLTGTTTESGSSTTETVETPSLTYSETDKTVTFKCATSGVTYYYSYSESGDYTALDGSSLDVSDHIGETLYAYAELDGSKSDTNSVELTETSTEPTVSGYELLTGDITSGDQVMIYYPAGGTAVTGTASGSKLTGGEVTVADGVMETNNVGEVFTVYVDDSGYLSFVTDEGAYLTCGSTGNSLTLESSSSDYSLWTLESAGESGSYYIKSVNAVYNGNAQYIEYYNGFTTYGFNSSSTAAYTYQFYYVGHTDAEQPSTGGDTEEDEGLTSGTYVIWAPAYNMALSSSYGTYYNDGVEVTQAEDGTLSGYSSTEVWTVTVNEDGTITIAYGDQNLGMADSYSSLTLGAVNDQWTLEDAGDGLYYVKNTVRECYIEWYSSKNYWSGYGTIGEGSEGMFALQFTAVEDTEEDDGTVTGTLADSIAQGDQVVIYYPNGGLAMTGTASSSKLTGVAGTVETTDEDTTLTTTSDALILTVRETDEGYYTFENGGLYLTSGSTGSSLTLAEKSDYSLWELEETDTAGSFYIKNVNAKYGSNNQYVEYYSGFTTYSFSTSNPTIYVYQFYKTGTTDVGVEYDTDSSIEESIASWGGGGPYTEGATSVSGDLYNVNDMLDSNATFTAVVSGEAVQTFTTGTSSGSTDISNWYMGGTGLGSGTDDYLQFAVSSAGWGDMELSFRMRASNTGSGEWQLQYSTDGETFNDFTTGTYSCSYTSYSSDGSSSAVTLSGDITDGVAKTSIKSATYITFTFDVPAGAENAENLYIRLVPSTTVAAGSGKDISNQGTVRIDSVVLSGSPIVDDSITGYVAVTPDNSEDQAVGTELTMS